MKKLKLTSLICLIAGLVAIVYGWTQSWAFGADFRQYEEMLMKRTIRFYVFIVSGFILILIGIIVDYIRKVFVQIQEKNNG
ncbi:hypothetical protein EDD68_101188 [Melghiribacillus thermohalophilus]|uniref:Uncharacterized protein n=1 Tax=Melghiribacillus thermohalophilus TaxID=1324956 RepID=A0A4R3NDW8_9BACI|nr:hypothetical protein [Melghiribacillus thermohalophilus]TCT26835.1 hypothetical protein EDD68_101188 [Melghiribacillus thermohalophilus]